MTNSRAVPSWPAFNNTSPPSDTILVLEGLGQSFVVDRDGMRIGSKAACEFLLQQGPALHSVVHQQSGATWIETVEDSLMLINGLARSRMALREGDVIDIHGLQLTARFRSRSDLEDAAECAESELSLLSASELCDRIFAEQTMINDFEEGGRGAWKNLMAAMKAHQDDSQTAGQLPLSVESEFLHGVQPENCERLFGQIRELSEMIDTHSRELGVCEAELVTAAALLEVAQGRVSQQIEELLEQLPTQSRAIDLRASA